jgi:PAP2 superfamily
MTALPKNYKIMQLFYMKKIKKLLFAIPSIIVGSLMINSCNKTTEEATPVVAEITADVPVRWVAMTLKIAEKTPGNSPTYASRGFGYLGLTMYETVVNGYPEYKSLAGQLSDLSTLPKPTVDLKYNYVLSLNAGQAYMLKSIYEQTSDINKASIDSLEKVIVTEISKTESADVATRSIKYGQDVAKAIFDWSKTDFGYQGYKNNFTLEYKLPTGLGIWSPPTFSQSASQLPLHPYWGKNRTFVANDATLSIPKPIPYSADPRSQYYAQFLEVYAKNKVLTQEEKETALWWGDDPSQTFTPPGHSYSLANIAVKTAKPNLIKAAQTYAAVGMGIADAFVNCWKCKYAYVAERPSTFIRRYIDGSFVQFWPEPPFPAFYSGHAVQSGATGTILTALYGTDFKFVDNSHQGRQKDPLTLLEFKNRTFNSFWEAAEESAYSRFLGGIHTRSDNDTGLAEGRKIGQNVNALKWKK